MVEDKNEIFINCKSDSPTMEEWMKMGSPVVWLLVKTIVLNRLSHKKVIKVWEDTAYGSMRIEVNGKVETGKDIVQAGEFIVLGEYYGYEEPKVFRRIGG